MPANFGRSKPGRCAVQFIGLIPLPALYVLNQQGELTSILSKLPVDVLTLESA